MAATAVGEGSHDLEAIRSPDQTPLADALPQLWTAACFTQSFLVSDTDGDGGDHLSAARTTALWRGALPPGFKLGAAASGTCRFHVPGRVFVQDADAPRERRDHVYASRAREQMRDAAHEAAVDEVRRLIAASALELEKVADPLSLHLRRSLRDAKHWKVEAST